MHGPHPALQIGLRVDGRRCLVIGGGPGADERASRLAAAGAIVARDDRLDGAFAIFCHNPARADALAADARARGILYYAHDRPDLSDFSMPALARRGPVQIAVATDGASPALAGRLRAELARLLDEAGPALDALVAEAAAARPTKAELGDRLRIEGRIVVSGSPGPPANHGL
jgi:siroheme synthase (precorrin-2 oxidase/ferrochelatase)